jgi:hypothetical protein
MIAIPPAFAEGYRKSLMARYLTRKVITHLEQYMLLPKYVAEAKVVLMSQIEMQPHLKDANCDVVIENLKKMATQYYMNTGKHLDLRIDVPREMTMLFSSGDPSSAPSERHASREVSDVLEEFASDEGDLTEQQLVEEEKRLDAEEKRIAQQKQLRERKRALDERRKKLIEATKDE